MAQPRSSSMHACIHVPPPCLQTAVVLLASFIMLAVAVAAEAPLPGVHDITDARGATTTSAAISKGGGASPAMTQSVPLHFSRDAQYKYLMEVFVDRRKFRAVADTGSSLTWLRSAGQKMSSNTLCCSSKCTGSSSCKCEGEQQCSFDIHYGGGSHRWGSMFTEKLSFHAEKHNNADDNKEQDGGIAIGWSEDTNPYDGVVGLGRGEQSLVKQLGHHTLSYCLATPTKDGGDQKSKLIVGGAHSADDAALQDLLEKSACQQYCKVHTTSLLPPYEEFYYVHLKSIKLGDETIINLPKVNAGKSSERTANMFIDSGAYLTTLEQEAYKKVVDHVNNSMPETAVKVPHKNTVCWSDGHPKKLGSLEPDLKKLGAFELHFAGEKEDAVLYLKKDQILYDDGQDEEKRKRVCLAFKERDPKKTPIGLSVLGNFQQQNLLMHFDISENKLSFVRVDDCAKVNI